MSKSKHVPVLHRTEDGREFVSIQDFLAGYNPKEEVEDYFFAAMKSIDEEGIEKRSHDALVQGLVRGYFSKKNGERTSPIVTKDGWVFWLFAAHERFLRALGLLYSDGLSDDDMFAIKNGLAWYMSGERRGVIVLSRSYPATHDDKAIFKGFTVQYID